MQGIELQQGVGARSRTPQRWIGLLVGLLLAHPRRKGFPHYTLTHCTLLQARTSWWRACTW